MLPSSKDSNQEFIMPRLFVTSLLTLFAMTSAFAEDQIVKINGAIISGQIVSEDGDAVVLSIRGIELRIPKSEIREIVRDEEAAPAPAGASESGSSAPVVEMPEPEAANKWERRTDASGNQVPLVAIIPVGTEGREQVGTDIVPEVYEAMIPVLRDMQPDYVVFHVNCNDKRENGYWYQVKREESSMNDFDLLGEIADVWHNRFEDEGIYAQPICWVQDAVGSSAVLSLSFCDLYTSSEATIGGLQGAAQMFERVRNDENTYGKYREAFLGMFRGPLELGRIRCDGAGHDNALLDALVYPDMRLSATWQGRTVKWELNRKGSYIVDDNDKSAVEFSAKEAGDFLISKGMADDLEDLLLLHELVDFDLDDTSCQEVFDDYSEDWRKALAECKTAIEEMQELQAGVGPSDAMRQAQFRLTRMKKILRMMSRYSAVELRCQMEFGLSKLALKLQIEQLEEQIRAMRSNDRGRQGGGRGAPRGGGRGIGGR